MTKDTESTVFEALDRLAIEVPSWGFADTGTRFGKFHQPAAAVTLEEKFHDAGLVHRLTAASPTMAIHVQWDLSPEDSPQDIISLAKAHGVGVGSINPNVFQDPCYKFGSFCSPDAGAQRSAREHLAKCITLGAECGSQCLSMWLGDGTNYPGQDNLRRRKRDLQAALCDIHQQLDRDWPTATFLIETNHSSPPFTTPTLPTGA